ncbi:hypothetical protein [Photobacterium sanguinicancri]|uniref:Uncharacterized protein n=1 Tax=Photobacterium sanguinicancri TaxID=875932 RepID=A0ABX4G1J1_9GAMM|nr:hypothetical protein [Photobacterium sanguinicancri]OZS44912.1 hypothetical protein ASV53_05730 [Photobacterium sanguinicancri]
MMLLVPTIAILVLYFYFYGIEGLNFHVISAVVVMAMYLLLFYVASPSGLQYSGSKMGGLYLCLPVVSFGALVFADTDENSHEQKWCFVLGGWFGLLTALSFLVFFKFYYW